MKIEEAIEYMQDGVKAIHNECDTMLNNNSEFDDALELIKETSEKYEKLQEAISAFVGQSGEHDGYLGCVVIKYDGQQFLVGDVIRAEDLIEWSEE